MIWTHLNLNLEGRKFFDKLAGEKISLEEVRATIRFTAPYALYAFNSRYSTATSRLRGSRSADPTIATESASRQIREKSILRRSAEIRNDFSEYYLKNFTVTGAAQYASRKHLEAMRRYELRAPGPRPPSRNPYDNRLRRITGQLADTAVVPRVGKRAGRSGGSSYVRKADAARYARRFKRATTFDIGGNYKQR